MRIVVIGAGGIGGWLGARLAASGQQVGFLVHDRTLAALRSGGLTLRDCSRGDPGTVTARIETPLASEDPQALNDALGGDPDLVLVTTKVDALPQLASALRVLTGPDTGVVSTQNGISAPELLADAVGKGLPGSTPPSPRPETSAPSATPAPWPWGSGTAPPPLAAPPPSRPWRQAESGPGPRTPSGPSCGARSPSSSSRVPSALPRTLPSAFCAAT